MDAFSLLALGILALSGVVAASANYRRSRDDVTRRAFAKPIVNISDVRNGTVVVVAGTLGHVESIPSHLSGQPCGLYEYVEAYELESVWHEHVRLKGGVEFSLRDETGEALVEGASAEVLLNKHNRVPNGDGRWERREGVVTSGDQVAVVGHANWEPDPRPQSAGLGYRERPVVLVIRGTRRTQVRVSNSPAILARAPGRAARKDA